MSRKKNVAKGLIDSAESAFFAGIEIHNKPRLPYRYPTATILIINAWELVLKAFIYKFINKKKIYDENGHTISFSKALTLVHEHINKTEGNKKFNAVRENLFLLEEYRNNFSHYFDSELDPIIFMLLSKATINFNEFLEKYFKREIMRSENLIILPIGFKLPFDPIEYLGKKAENDESNKFINGVLQAIKTLKDEGIAESVVVGFNVLLGNIKTVDNADIIAAIDATNPNAISISRTYRITDDPNAPAVRGLDEVEIIKQQYPYSFNDLVQEIKKLVTTFKQNEQFYKYLKLIKENKEWYKERLLNPLNPQSSKTGFYSQKAVMKLVELYSEGKNNF